MTSTARRRQRPERVDDSSRAAEDKTLIIRNLPNHLTRQDLLHALDSNGYAGDYDFVYLPIDFTTGCGLGYAFVNMTCCQRAAAFIAMFTGRSCRSLWATSVSGKV